MKISRKLLIIPITLLFLGVFSLKTGDVFAQYFDPNSVIGTEPAPGAPVVTDTSGMSPVGAGLEQALINAGYTPEFAASIVVFYENSIGNTSTSSTNPPVSTTVTNPDGSTTTTTTSTTTVSFSGNCGNPPFEVTTVTTTTTPGQGPPNAGGDGGGGTTTPPVVPPPVVPPPGCSGCECDGSCAAPTPPPALNDLTIAVKAGNQTQYNPNSTANLTFTVTNNGSSAVTSQVGFWPRGGVGANNLSSCPLITGNPILTQSVTMNPGESKDATFSFNVGATGATGYAYASYNCSPSESTWGNNITAQTYVVSTATWFESLNGDVGSQGSINVTQVPPAGRYQSSYLLAGQNLDPKVQTQKWKLNNYTSQLVPSGGVYNYLAERFLATAKKTPGNGCNIPSGNANGFNYCSGNATFNAGGAPNGNGVWFIDGDLTIQKDMALAAGDSMTFVVKGNITINTSVKRADGIYVTNGTFNDADSNGNLGAQLVVNGGVYAQGVNLARVLGGAACPSGAACDNALTPADQFVFDPKYLVGLNNIIGTPSISWMEAAP